VEVVPYTPEWLPQLAELARAHARLTLPGLELSEDEVAGGLERHRFWPFYSPGLAGAETQLVVDDGSLLAAGQTGFVGYGWGYGAAPDDGPDWLYDYHCSLLWLFAWPGYARAGEAAALLAATVVGWARESGLPGLEAFRGGPGFFPFGTQLSSHWPHLCTPLRGAGFRQPRDLLVYAGETEPDSLPELAPPEGRFECRGRRGRLEAWLDGEPVGAAVAMPLAGRASAGRSVEANADPRRPTWAVIRRLIVAEHLRGRGIGSALLAEQLRRLHAAGVRRYLLHIPNDPQEAAAHALYLKFGRLADRQQVLRVSF
jgi:GNAT superfamily N-acetyltransferase